MHKSRGVIITVRTKDYKNFKDYYKDLYKQSFELLGGKLFVTPYIGKVHDEDPVDVTMLKISTEAWDILKPQYRIIDEFVKSLSYYEMIIVTDDRNAEYTADRDTYQKYGKLGCNIHYEYHISILTEMKEQYD